MGAAVKRTDIVLAACAPLLATAVPADSPPAFTLRWGTYGTGAGQFVNPEALAVDDSGYVYVADFSNNRVQKFTLSGAFVREWGVAGSGDGQFANPSGLAVGAGGDGDVAD